MILLVLISHKLCYYHLVVAGCSITYALGSSLLWLYIMQWLSGIVLATSSIVPCNAVTSYTMIHSKDFTYSSMIVTLHRTIATVIMLIVYFHLLRNYYDYSGKTNAISAVAMGYVLYLALSAMCFTGYCLPVSNLSYHALCVIFNVVTVVPLYSLAILKGLYGGSSPHVSSIIGVRLWFIHMICAQLTGLLIYAHLYYLHIDQSSQVQFDKVDTNVKLHGSMAVTDVFWCSYILLTLLIGYNVNEWSYTHSSHWRIADTLKTPTHLRPELYFLPQYGLLRCIPDKALGILCLVILMGLPTSDSILTHRSIQL